MIVKELMDGFGLQIAAGEKGLDRRIQSGYSGDLLSEIMGNAPIGCAWLTVQTHQNIVAVAVLREMAVIILAGGYAPDEETVSRANTEGIPILQSEDSAFFLAGRLFAAGIGNSEDRKI